MNISEVSILLDITASTIRYYEKINLIPPITRNSAGIRTFTEEDIKWVEFAKCMRSVGLPIDNLKEYTQLVRQGADEALEKRKQILLESQQSMLKKKEEIESVLERLEDKINDYEDRLSKKEKDMKNLIK
ncbi:MerR family transcriptional regulator [Marinilactibacillus sp. Marseille-P9653]|uniref:MerR family transcriptional regulator n=1 Tax=Marinilactibacillus sp. Marseille-P9653 TaxID=2866583 RepID=UPI001CE3DB7E|nr:MerR family transcriptional regulator [Marinilactibacillus sp. Marseille-P9653]